MTTKSQITISIDTNVKEAFTDLARSMGSNTTNLLNMMIVNTLKSKDVTFTTQGGDFLEFTSFLPEELEELEKSSKHNTDKLENYFKNKDKEGM